ncbi:MAG: hypothetical protein ACW981_11830 [Candidatus Hodarchaeales archaeon]|jgi:hypothetical protein
MSDSDIIKETNFLKLGALKKKVEVDVSVIQAIKVTSIPILILFVILIFNPTGPYLYDWIIISLLLVFLFYMYYKLSWITGAILLLEKKLEYLTEKEIIKENSK